MNTISITNIIEQENKFFYEAKDKYGDYFSNALDFNSLLQTFVKSVKIEGYIYISFLSQIRKHHTLAIFSAVRRHHVQTVMNLRQVLEAGANAAYAIANPKIEDFGRINCEGVMETPDDLRDKRYKWLDENYQNGSNIIKNLKINLNKSCMHSNIAYTQQNFKLDDKNNKFLTPFFDEDDQIFTKNDLWFIGNIALGLMDFLYGVNKKYNLITFTDNFVESLHAIEYVNNKLKLELLNDNRFKKYEIPVS